MKHLLIVFLVIFQNFNLAHAMPGDVTDADIASMQAAAAASANKGVIYTVPATQGYQASTNGLVKACEVAAESAKTACLASLSPKIQGAAAIIGGLISTVGMMKASSSQVCEKYSSAMKAAEVALAAYNGICTAMQASCETDCEVAVEGLRKDIPLIETAAKSAQASTMGMTAAQVETARLASITSNGEVTGAVSTSLGICKKYKWNLAAAGVGLTNMVKQSAMASACQKDTTVDCNADKYNPACRTVTDCGKAENQNQTACICQRTPNSPGCAGFTGMAINSQASTTNSNLASTDRGTGTYTPSANDSVAVTPGNAKNSGSAPASGAMGGGGGGLGSSGTGGVGGSANKVTGADANKVKGFNANILGGSEGGGGGGAFGGSSSSRSSGSQDSTYGAFMPGGKRDPAASVSKSSISNEVTASGSKSNFEKIREMYSAQQTSLMGN